MKAAKQLQRKEKNKMNKKIAFITTAFAACALAGCSAKDKEEMPKDFGIFSYNGTFLKEYACKTITSEEAKTLLKSETNTTKRMLKTGYDSETSMETAKSILTKCAGLVVTTKYYIDDSDKQQERKDLFQGTDFMNLLIENHYVPFGEMNVKFLFVDTGLIDYMESENVSFKLDEANLVAPFIEPYTYHSNDENHLIIQTHSFAELPASINGGIGSTFREDCELVFDEEGKINLWQASLGLYTATPTGTVREGYIFEASFEWLSK